MKKKIANKFYINTSLKDKVLSYENQRLSIKLNCITSIVKKSYISIIGLLLGSMIILGILSYFSSPHLYQAKAILVTDSQLDDIDCKKNSIYIMDKTLKNLNLNFETSNLLEDVKIVDNVEKKYIYVTIQDKDPITAVNLINKVAFNLQSELSKIYIGNTISVSNLAQSSENLTKLKVTWSVILGLIMGIMINFIIIMKDYFKMLKDTPVHG